MVAWLTENNTPDSAYFIHQAGVYLKTPDQTEPFLVHCSPRISAYARALFLHQWGRHAYEDLEHGFYFSLLYYSKYTILGDGLLQVDQMMYNFGQDKISFINVPGGGVRHSNLGETFISNPDHTFNHVDGLYGATPVIQASTTAGWVGWSNDLGGDALSCGSQCSVNDIKWKCHPLR